MKKLAIGISLLFCLNAMSQSIPKNIEDAFKKQHPSAVDAEWTTYSSKYVVEFSSKDVYKTAHLDKKGVWLKTVSQVEAEDLPKPVMTVFNKKFGSSAFESAELVEMKGMQYYDIAYFDDEEETKHIALDATGKTVEVETDAETTEEDEEYSE